MTTKHTCRHCGGEAPLRYRRGYRTLPIAERIINAHGAPMRIREIFEAGRLLWPLRGATPQNTLYRDIALSIRSAARMDFMAHSDLRIHGSTACALPPSPIQLDAAILDKRSAQGAAVR